MRTQVQHLGTTESVALCETDNNFGAVFSRGLSSSVGFHIEVVGAVEKEVERNVEGAASICFVVWLERNA